MKTLLIHSKKHGVHDVYYDDEDEALVSQYTWCIKKALATYKQDIYYCYTNVTIEGKSKTRIFHRLLLGITDPKIFVDHINHNGLDNQRHNLRICSKEQNPKNARPQKGRVSSYKGVTLNKKRVHLGSPWRARIMVDRKSIHLGYFPTEEAAARAYNAAALQYFGEYAFPNSL